MPRKELNLTELKNWCAELSKKLADKQIILLSGDLGVGKTQFVQFMVSALGGGESTSPTYSVINEYQTKRGLIHHVDLYRLSDIEELDSVGFWDLFTSQEGLIFIEWANRLGKSEIPVDWKILDLKIEVLDEERRTFFYESH